MLDNRRLAFTPKIPEKLEKLGYDHRRASEAAGVRHGFEAELSTRDAVSETSSRGVGMDAIKAAAEELGGKAWVETQTGHGTQLFVEVPWLTDVGPLKMAS